MNTTNQQKGWEKRMSQIVYPDWIYQELATEELREKLKNHQIKGKDKVAWICPEHGVYEQRFSSHVTSSLEHGQGCRKCAARNNVTARFGTVSRSTPSTSSPLYLPAALDSFKRYMASLGINESRGIWEKNNVVIIWSDFTQDSDVYPNMAVCKPNRTKYYNLWDSYRKQGKRLIVVNDYYWLLRPQQMKNIIQDAVERRVTVYARNCDVQLIEKKVAVDFLNKYHVDGNSSFGSIFYGLYKGGDLLQVMSFSRMRYKSVSDQYEIARMATHPFITIVGGTSKLITHFIRDYNPELIMTYANNTWFTGNGYEAAGFTEVANYKTTPSYVWIEVTETGLIKHAREEVQPWKIRRDNPWFEKEYNDNQDKYLASFEQSWGSYLGWYRINDAGNRKFEWRKEKS